VMSNRRKLNLVKLRAVMERNVAKEIRERSSRAHTQTATTPADESGSQVRERPVADGERDVGNGRKTTR
jgi:hypothetical protein